MDTINEAKTEKDFSEGDSGKGCCGWHKRRRFWAGKLVVAIILIAVIFGLGVAAGSLKSFGRSGGGYKNIGYPMMKGGSNMMSGYRSPGVGQGLMSDSCRFSSQNTNAVSGVISKIEGTKITVNDNGNQEKIIISVSSTKIISASGDISLSALKTGQTISATGITKDSQLEATVIRVY